MDNKTITLVIADSTGKNIGFITNDFIFHTLREVIRKVQTNLIDGLHIVNSEKGTYVRSNPNSHLVDNLDKLSVPAGSLSQKSKRPSVKDKVLYHYLTARSVALEAIYRKSELIYLDGLARGVKKEIQNRLKPLRSKIKEVANKHDIDPKLLTAILIDELVRSGPDDFFDALGYLGVNTTVGLAQVKLSTARELIKLGYYKGAKKNISSQKLYDLLVKDDQAIEFAGAYIRRVYDYRIRTNKDISFESIATCYSYGLSFKKIMPRGKTIIKKFFPFARKLLSNK